MSLCNSDSPGIYCSAPGNIICCSADQVCLITSSGDIEVPGCYGSTLLIPITSTTTLTSTTTSYTTTTSAPSALVTPASTPTCPICPTATSDFAFANSVQNNSCAEAAKLTMILAPLLMVFLLLLGLLAFGMLWHRHKKTCGARNTMVAAAVDPVYSGAYITKDLQPGYIQRRVEEMPTN